MSAETEQMAKTINKCFKELGKFISGIDVAITIIGYTISAILATCALYFAYGWVITHPERMLLIVGCCAFWIITNWRKP